MILKALCDYYKRCDNSVPIGYELRELGFLIVISKDGAFRSIEDCRNDNKHGRLYLVPKAVLRPGVKAGLYPCLLWDNVNFVLGVPKGKKQNPEGLYFDAFKAKVNELSLKYPESVKITAVDKFYSDKRAEDILHLLSTDALYADLLKTNKSVSFRIEGDTQIVAEDEVLRIEVSNTIEKCGGQLCMVTGLKSEIARIHHKTPMPGAAFASLISFQKSKGYDSYGKEQAFNAPISVDVEFAYTSAINAMLGKDSKNKFVLGNRTYLFWASKTNEAAIQTEQSLFDILNATDKKDDNPNVRIENARCVFKSIYNGVIKTGLDDRFYVLGLAPNAARISVVYWSDSTLKEFASKILRHFDDMEIVDNRKDKQPYSGVKNMLRAVTLNGDLSEVTPNLPDALVRSVFEGYLYPETLYTSCLKRIKAETSEDNNPVRIARAAIIKAYLNRLYNNNNIITIMLDKENTNQGYLCGRLFAVLDKIQDAANGQNSIRSSYMNAASVTPSVVFGRIMSLSNAHITKLSNDKPGLAHYFEKMKGEIIAQITPNGFPAHLDLEDQGRFYVGYYHQLYYKEETNNN